MVTSKRTRLTPHAYVKYIHTRHGNDGPLGTAIRTQRTDTRIHIHRLFTRLSLHDVYCTYTTSHSASTQALFHSPRDVYSSRVAHQFDNSIAILASRPALSNTTSFIACALRMREIDITLTFRARTGRAATSLVDSHVILRRRRTMIVGIVRLVVAGVAAAA